MAQQALDASGRAFIDPDMELSLPEVTLHQEEGVSEELHHNDENTLGNPPPRKPLVVKVTQAPGSLPSATTAQRSHPPTSEGNLIVEEPLPEQGTSKARNDHCDTLGAHPPRAQGSDHAPATNGHDGAQGLSASHGQARHPNKGNQQVKHPSVSQGPRQTSRSDKVAPWS